MFHFYIHILLLPIVPFREVRAGTRCGWLEAPRLVHLDLCFDARTGEMGRKLARKAYAFLHSCTIKVN